MDWTILLNAFASALGGVATAILVIGFFGKSLFDHWFKKSYKEWESELERRLQEDFKRFEAKIDSISANEKVRYNLAFTKRADAIEQLHRQTQSLKRRLTDYFRVEDLSRDQLELLDAADEARKKLWERLLKYQIDIHDRSYLFSMEAKERLEQVFNHTRKIVSMIESGNPFELTDAEMTVFNEEIGAVECEFRRLIDAAILEN